MQLLARCALVAVLAVALTHAADESHEPQASYQDFPPREQHGGYHRAPSYGYGPRPPVYGRRPYGGRHGHQEYYDYDDSKPLDVVDKLYHRLNTLHDELKTGSEILGNLEARLSLGKKKLDELLFITIPGTLSANIDQQADIDSLSDEMDEILDDIDELEIKAEDIESINTANLNDQEEAEELYAAQRKIDIRQEGDIAELLAKVHGLKDKLLTVVSNEFITFDQTVKLIESFLSITKKAESDRMCEVGQVTLDADDRKAEYLFQSDFAFVPQVLYSLCGYNFDLEKRPDNYNGYAKEPNAMGVFVTADASKTGVTLEMFDQSFGDTAVTSVDVCFQVCSINPGARVDEVLQELI